MSYKLVIELIFLNYIALLAGVISVLFYWSFVIGLNFHFLAALFQPQIDGVFFRLFLDIKFWIALIFLPIIALVPDMTLKYFKMMYMPTPSDYAVKNNKRIYR